MKRILSAFLLIGGLIMVGAPAAHATDHNDHPDKVTLCHYANGNSHAITVAYAAADTHLVFHIIGSPTPAPGHLLDRFLHYGDEVKPDDEANCAGDNVVIPPGPPGDNGLTPTLICVPGVGIRATFSEPVLAEDEFILNDESEVCPLAGENGNDGADGVDGVDGLNGTNGVNGSTGAAGPVGLTGVAGPTSVVTVTEAAPAPVASAPAAEATPAPAGELPHTGTSATTWLAGLGLLMVAMGLGLRFFRTRTSSNA